MRDGEASGAPAGADSGTDGEADSLDFALANMQKTYDIMSQRTQYLDGRAAAFLSLLGLAGSGVAAFTAFILSSGGSAARVARLRTNPAVDLPFALALLSYVGAAAFTAWAGAVKSAAAPTLLDAKPRPFDPDHPAGLPAKAALQANLISATWAAINEINEHVNWPKHRRLSVALVLVVLAILFASILSAAVFLTLPSS